MDQAEKGEGLSWISNSVVSIDIILKPHELLKLLLPSDLIELVELIFVEPMEDGYHLFLDQRNIPPAEFVGRRLESKGFLNQVIIRNLQFHF